MSEKKSIEQLLQENFIINFEELSKLINYAMHLVSSKNDEFKTYIFILAIEKILFSKFNITHDDVTKIFSYFQKSDVVINEKYKNKALHKEILTYLTSNYAGDTETYKELREWLIKEIGEDMDREIENNERENNNEYREKTKHKPLLN